MKVSFLFLFLFSCIISKAQHVDIVLKKLIGQTSFVFQAPPSEESASPLEVPNYVHMNFFYYYYVSIAPIEEAFRKMKEGKMTKAQFQEKIRNYRKTIDTNKLAERVGNYPSSTFHIISGVDDDDNRIFLIDRNQDGKITPDEIVIYKRKFIDSLNKNIAYRDSLKSFTFSQIGKNNKPRSLSFKINPRPYFNDYASENQKQTSFGLIRNEYWAGQQTINNRLYTFVAGSKQFSNELNDMQFNIKCDTTYNKLPVQTKEEWANQDLSLFVDSVLSYGDSKVKLRVSYQTPPIIHKDTTFAMVLTNVQTGNLDAVRTLLNKGKYILFDYWGTWCAPCIEKIPIVKEINDQFSSKLTIISIAYDYDILTVKRFDETHQSSWNSYYINRNKQQDLIKSLKVTSFPTYRLYNEKGKLITQGDSEKELTLIKEILAKNMSR